MYEVLVIKLSSAAREFYEKGVSKMLKIFPLSDDILKMVPAADPLQRDKYTATQVRDLASKLMYTDSESLDAVYTEWSGYQLDDTPQPPTYNIGNYWSQAETQFPKLAALMKALLCIPHSNAQSERVFSMLKKIRTDQRSDLCKDSINSLLTVKQNSSTCCHDTELSKELLVKCKRAAREYNRQHCHNAAATIVDITDADAE